MIAVVIGVFFLQKYSIEPGNQLKAKRYKVRRKNIQEVLSLAGKIAAEERVVLRFQSSGRLSWVGVKVGDYVKKYQGIAALDQRSTQKTLEKYLREYAKERLDFDEDRFTTYKDKALTDTMKRILEKNQYDLEKAVLDVELQQLAIEYSYLYTPIEGIVVRVDVPVAGVNITPAQAEFEIVNPKTVYFSATVDQTEVGQLRQGMKGKIIFDAYPDEQVEGEVGEIAFTPKSGESGTTYEAKIYFQANNDQLKYRMEMTGDIDFLVKERKNILAVPENYVKTEKNKNYIWKDINGRKVKAYIKTGDEIDGSIEITSGLKEGDYVYD